MHVADGAELPGDGAVLVSAARFLEDPEARLRRARQDRRDLAEQPRSSTISCLISTGSPRSRWCSRASATAAPIARPACCASATAIDGELRATGQVLRDQFVFMLRAGFDAFEVKKESDAEAFTATARRYSVFYQPTGDGRLTALHRRMQLRHSESAGQ